MCHDPDAICFCAHRPLMAFTLWSLSTSVLLTAQPISPVRNFALIRFLIRRTKPFYPCHFQHTTRRRSPRGSQGLSRNLCTWLAINILLRISFKKARKNIDKMYKYTRKCNISRKAVHLAVRVSEKNQ